MLYWTVVKTRKPIFLQNKESCFSIWRKTKRAGTAADKKKFNLAPFLIMSNKTRPMSTIKEKKKDQTKKAERVAKGTSVSV